MDRYEVHARRPGEKSFCCGILPAGTPVEKAKECLKLSRIASPDHEMWLVGISPYGDKDVGVHLNPDHD